MMKAEQPRTEEWGRLYAAAMSYRDLAPWNWMEDDGLFGVMNPEDGEIGYCGVLGGLGEVFALVVYEGPLGWEGFMKMHNGEFDEDDFGGVMESQLALMASFEERDRLEEEDRRVIRSLGLKLRGKNAWPMFRHYLPGYYPWYLTGAQARFLTLALEQSLEVHSRCRDNPSLLPPVGSEKLLVRVMAEVGGRSEWRDEFFPPPGPVEQELPQGHSDDLRLERIRRGAKRTDVTWEIGYCLAPMPLRERPGARPFFPRLLMAVEESSGFVLTGHLEGPFNQEDKLMDHLLEYMEKSRCIPRLIHVANERAEAFLGPVARKLGIIVHRKKRLPQFERAFRCMLEECGR